MAMPHASFEFRLAPALLAAVLIATAWGRAAAGADASDWSKGQKSAARLISGGGFGAGVEIRLDPGSLTYWRNPGEAGVPPVFSFSRSKNLKAAVVRYPAPRRFVEAGSDVFGYRGSVIFPVDVTPLDPGKPVELVLDLQYAACDKICVPAEAKARLVLSAGDPRTPQADRIEAFAALAPRRAEGAGTPVFRLARIDGGKPSWSVAVSPAPGEGADLFAEFPDGWYFDSRKSGEGFSLLLDQRPAEAAREVEVTLTLVAPSGAWEKTLRLDAGPATP